MSMNPDSQLEAFCVIVNHGYANKILKYAKQYGVSGGTVFLGIGTSKSNKLLNLLDLNDTRKEILLMLLDRSTIDASFDAIAEKFKFTRPNHGIAFTILVSKILGSHLYSEAQSNKEVNKPMHKAIFTIVDKGKAEDVVAAANRAGSRGGTIINARGSGIHETSKLFNMAISPEKEVVLILAKTDDVSEITKTIVDALDINKPGNGIIFVQDVNQTYGLY